MLITRGFESGIINLLFNPVHDKTDIENIYIYIYAKGQYEANINF